MQLSVDHVENELFKCSPLASEVMLLILDKSSLYAKANIFMHTY